MKARNKPMPFYLKEFLFYMEIVCNRSERTVDAYYTDLLLFLRFVKKSKCLSDKNIEFSDIDISDISISTIQSITIMDVYEFLEFVSTDRFNSAKTRARKATSIRMFFKYLNVNTQYLPKNPVEHLQIPKVKNPLPKYLTLSQSKDLLDSVDGQFKTRDFCILTLFLNCGFRLSELVNINTTDIFDDKIRVTGKGNKQRVIYLNDACKSAVTSYLNDSVRVKPKGCNALFTSRQGNRISPRRVEQIVTQALNNIGLSNQGLSTHKLRHTAATLLYQYGNVDVRVLQMILGHEGLQTTQIYTHVAEKQIEDAINNSPLADVTSPKVKKVNSDK